MQTLVLFSSANPQGNTAKVVENVAKYSEIEVINIDKLTISAYNYQNQYPVDDFYPLVEKMLHADNIVFASPVYWSAMTAPMKQLFDRITELTDVSHLKPKGRALAGKRGFVIASSASPQMCEVFEQMFAKFFRYFDMHYAGKLHASGGDKVVIEPGELSAFIAALTTTKPSKLPKPEQALAPANA